MSIALRKKGKKPILKQVLKTFKNIINLKIVESAKKHNNKN